MCFAGPFPQYLVVPPRVPVNSDRAFADLYLRPELGGFTFSGPRAGLPHETLTRTKTMAAKKKAKKKAGKKRKATKKAKKAPARKKAKKAAKKKGKKKAAKK
jgi:hypothetical protein